MAGFQIYKRYCGSFLCAFNMKRRLKLPSLRKVASTLEADLLNSQSRAVGLNIEFLFPNGSVEADAQSEYPAMSCWLHGKSNEPVEQDSGRFMCCFKSSGSLCASESDYLQTFPGTLRALLKCASRVLHAFSHLLCLRLSFSISIVARVDTSDDVFRQWIRRDRAPSACLFV